MPRLCVIPGDGIGREVVPAAVEVLSRAITGLETVEAEAGWGCFQKHGVSVPDETLATIRECGAALFGAVQSPAKKVEGYRSAIITIRQALDLYSNIRPVRTWPRVSPRPGIDMIIVRENTEGLYAGREHMDGEDTAIAERVITRNASRRIGERAFGLACDGGRKRVTIVHKANVLPVTDGLFRDTVREVAATYAADGCDVGVDELLVDTAAMKMVADPGSFDVVVTTNLFGYILSDCAAPWGGGMGLAPSLNWGDGMAVAEPVHGSAPDIAGQGIANPIAAILSGAMLARYVWGCPNEADRIERAVASALESGAGEAGMQTGVITERVIERLG